MKLRFTQKELTSIYEQAKHEGRLYDAIIQLYNERHKAQAQLYNCESGGDAPRLLLSEDFTGGQLTSPNLEFYTSMPEVYEADNQPYYVSCYGTSAAHYYAKEGTNEKIPFEILLNKGELEHFGYEESFSEFCIEWRDFFAAGYGFPSSGQKMFRVMFDDSRYPESRKSTEIATLNDNTNLQYAAYIGNSDAWFQNSGEPHPVNKWVTWRVWVKLNDQGARNGFIHVYKDGEIFISGEGLKLRNDDDARGFNMWWVGGNYSMQGGVGGLPTSGHRYITGMRWWNTFPNE